MSKIENYRSRTHMLLLYPEDLTHRKAYETIQKTYDYASILHNKDVTEDGEIKKEHWHVVIRFNQPRWRSALCKDLGIAEYYMEEVKKFDNALQYLIHYNDTDKAQYDINEVQGPLKVRLVESLNKLEKGEGERVVELLQFIENRDKPITVTEFASFCAR